MQSPLRRLTTASASLLLATLLALLGNTLTQHGIARQGLAQWSAWRVGQSPWSWNLRQPRDLVAGRAFGAGRLVAARDGLAVVFTGGAVQLGLRVARPIPLHDVPMLRLDFAHSLALPAAIIIRSRLSSEACEAAASPLPEGAGTQWVDLALLHWRCHGMRSSLPQRAAMLRLRIVGPRGARLVIRRVAMQPTVHLAPGPPTGLAHWRKAQTPGRIAVVELPAGWSSRLLDERDAVWRVDPAAVVLPAMTRPHAVAKHPAWRCNALAIAACILLMLFGWPRRDPGRGALLLQALACLFPVILIALGVGNSGKPDLWSGLLVALALGYALLIGSRAPPGLGPWRWLAPWREWWLPMLPVALLLGLWLQDGVRSLGLGELLRYLPWALLQQYLLLVFVARRIDTVLPGRAPAVLACATLFALAHAPNTALMLLAFTGGLWWTWWFLQRRALLPVVIAHALAGAILQAITSNSGWLRSLAIGARYLGKTG